MTRPCVHSLSASLLPLFCCFNCFHAKAHDTQKKANTVHPLSLNALLAEVFSCVNKTSLFPLPLMLVIHCLHQHTGALFQMSVLLPLATGSLLSTSKCICNTITKQSNQEPFMLGCSQCKCGYIYSVDENYKAQLVFPKLLTTQMCFLQ